MHTPMYVVCPGDSLTAGYLATLPYPYQMALLYTDDRMMSVVNAGVNGSTIDTMTSRASTEADSTYDSRKGNNLLVVWCGTNNLGANQESAASAYAKLSSYCSARRAVGFKVIVLTMLPRNFAGDLADIEIRRQAFNALIRANWTTFADSLADVGNDPTIGQAGQWSNATYYQSDNVHLTNAGHAIIASTVKNKLDGFN